MRAGASGFLLKDTGPEQLTAAIHTVSRGEALLSPSIQRLIVAFTADRTTADPSVLTRLTGRETEVLQLIARGRSNHEIATELVLAETTVKMHVARLLAKLELRDRVQAVVLAYETGLVTPRR